MEDSSLFLFLSSQYNTIIIKSNLPRSYHPWSRCCWCPDRSRPEQHKRSSPLSNLMHSVELKTWFGHVCRWLCTKSYHTVKSTYSKLWFSKILICNCEIQQHCMPKKSFFSIKESSELKKNIFYFKKSLWII